MTEEVLVQRAMPDEAALHSEVLELRDTFVLCLVPSAVMLIASLTALSVTVPQRVVSAMQHLAAGIVLSAVAVELVPPILAAPNDLYTTLAMTLGFLAGIGTLLLVSAVAADGEEEEEEEDDDNEEEANEESADDEHATPYTSAADADGTTQEVMQSSSMDEMTRRNDDIIKSGFLDLAGTSALRRRLSNKLSKQALSRLSNQERASSSWSANWSANSLVRWASESGSANGRAQPFPYALTIAVGTDALVDGLLIGISSASGAQAGFVITGALSIEMGFLGLTFASTLRNQRNAVRLLAILLPPILLLLGGVCGGGIASLLASSPPLHTGLLAFGVAALLYLVTEELLLEAHAAQPEEHIWWVDAMFFTGFYLSLLLEKFSRA